MLTKKHPLFLYLRKPVTAENRRRAVLTKLKDEQKVKLQLHKTNIMIILFS